MRISDEELRAAVDRMTLLAHPRGAVEGQERRASRYSIVNPAAQNGAAARRWPAVAAHSRALGLG